MLLGNSPKKRKQLEKQSRRSRRNEQNQTGSDEHKSANDSCAREPKETDRHPVLSPGLSWFDASKELDEQEAPGEPLNEQEPVSDQCHGEYRLFEKAKLGSGQDAMTRSGFVTMEEEMRQENELLAGGSGDDLVLTDIDTEIWCDSNVEHPSVVHPDLSQPMMVDSAPPEQLLMESPERKNYTSQAVQNSIP